MKKEIKEILQAILASLILITLILLLLGAPINVIMIGMKEIHDEAFVLKSFLEFLSIIFSIASVFFGLMFIYGVLQCRIEKTNTEKNEKIMLLIDVIITIGIIITLFSSVNNIALLPIMHIIFGCIALINFILGTILFIRYIIKG